MFPEAALSDPAHQALFEMLRNAWLAGESIHRDQLELRCARLDKGNRQGPTSTALRECLKASDSTHGSLDDLAAHLRDLYHRRELLNDARNLHARILDLSKPIDADALSHVDRIMRLMQDHGDDADSVMDVGQTRIVDLKGRPAGYNPGIPMGFPLLDENVCFCPGQVTVIAARPGDGKSAIAQQISLYASKLSDENIGLICSPEMSKFEVVDRLIAQETQLSLHALRTGQITKPENWKIIENGVQRFQNLFIFDKTDMSSRDIVLMARRIHARRKLKFLIVDYLQFLDEGDDKTPMHYLIRGSIRRLKALARALNIGVLALAQLNRNVIDKDGIARRPTLSDLGDSGAIERDADVVIGVFHTDEVLADGTRVVELIVLKNRNGEKGTEHTLWHPSRTTFQAMAPLSEQIDHDPEPPPPPPPAKRKGGRKETPSPQMVLAEKPAIMLSCALCGGHGVIYSDDPEDDGRATPCPTCNDETATNQASQ
jgi:replicative DNA helicase